MTVPRAETRVGWCPSVVTPMAADDGLLVRIKPTASTLTADQARVLAEACAAYGNGQIDLTNRSNLQIRGLCPDTAALFAEAMQAAGLAAGDARFEEIRNIAADPLGPDDPDAAHDSHALARALEAGLAAEPRLTALPPKFGFVVDCGHTLPLTGARGDVFLRPRDGRLTVEPDGGDRALAATPETAVDLCLRLALAFLDLAGPADRPPYRMRELIAAVGAETVVARAMEIARSGSDPAGNSAEDQKNASRPLVIPEGASATIRDRGAPAPSMEPGLTDPGSPAAPAAGMTNERQWSAPTQQSLPGLSRQSTGGDTQPRRGLDPRGKPWDDRGGKRRNESLSLVIPDGRQAEPGSGNPGGSISNLPGQGRPDTGSPATPAAGMTTEKATRRDHLDLMYAPPPADSPVGFLKRTNACIAGIPGGRLDAGTLAALADLSDRHADATLRLTPWRSVVFAKVDAGRIEALEHALTSLDLMTEPNDPRRSRRGPVTLSPPVDPVPATDHEFKGPTPMTAHYDYIREGAEIYRKSFATIRSEADLGRFTPDEARIAVRIIHACGMVEVAADLRFSEDFAVKARTALIEGRPILCDSRMVANGITRDRLPADNQIICTLADPEVAGLAEMIGNTRTAAAMELWGERMEGAVVAIGNAPTALFHLLEMIDAGAPKPAAVIGMPVGFVGAVESKQALETDGRLPFLTIRGRKGGSAMAVAAVNALASERE